MTRFSMLAILAALALVNTGAVAAQSVVADGGARLRSGPGVNYRMLGSLPAGTTIDVGSCNSQGTWCRVRTSRGSGWVAVNRIAQIYTGRPGQENYKDVGGGRNNSYRITGPMVDRPGYCYAVSAQNTMIIVPCR